MVLFSLPRILLGPDDLLDGILNVWMHFNLFSFLEGHRRAFLLRILAMRYFAAFSHTSGVTDGVVWERLLRCGAEYDKETRDDCNPKDGAIIVQEYMSIFKFIRGQWSVDLKHPCFQSWCDHFAFLARKVGLGRTTGVGIF